MIEILQISFVILLNNIVVIGGLLLIVLYIRKSAKKTVHEVGHTIESNLETVKIILGKGKGEK